MAGTSSLSLLMFSLKRRLHKKKVQNFPKKIPSERLQCGNSQLSLGREALPEARARLDQVSDAAAVQGILIISGVFRYLLYYFIS